MSENLHLSAKTIATLPSGNETTFVEHCELYQTPTDVTQKCIKSKNTLRTYFEWVYDTHVGNTTTIKVYESDEAEYNDVFSEYDNHIFSYQIPDCLDHIEHVKQFLIEHPTDDWSIIWEAY